MILGSKIRRGLASVALLVAAGKISAAGPLAPAGPAATPDRPSQTDPVVKPAAPGPIAVPGMIRIRQEPTPNAQTPNAQTPNAQTPNAQTPNAQTPNAQTPNAQTPNSIPPNAPSGPVPPPTSGLDRLSNVSPTAKTEAPTPPVGPPVVNNTTQTAPPPSATAAGTNTQISGAGGVAGAALNANSAADLLTKSNQSVGVEVQRRNAIVADPRVRGWRAGQFITSADGGLFAPARLDLDTAVAKFDSNSIRNIDIVKGPYSVLYGPGFSFLNINTIDSPRSEEGFKYGGRTSSGYQTNGQRWDGQQTIEVYDNNWGFRGTYNIMQGNDYRAGNGDKIASSYFSQNFNIAFGFDLNENSSLEFKALRVAQNDLEFPGLYFDISALDTEAYSIRYSLRNQPWFDKFNFDIWYNSTAASGDTAGGAKQAFVQRLLAQSFNPQLNSRQPLTGPGAPTGLALFRDDSTTRFAGRSIGYRAALSWGDLKDPNLTIGTDLNALGQGLEERINFTQLAGPTNVATGLPLSGPAAMTQNQSIPRSEQITNGLFAQSKIDLNDRWKLRSGGRIDWVNSQSDPRLITGNIDLFGNTPAPGFAANRTILDPIIYSSQPGNRSLDRQDFLIAGYVKSEYKLDDNWLATMSVGHSQRPPTLTELYAAGPFVGVLQQGTSRLLGDPNLSPEKLTQFDIGVEANYQYFLAGANVFYAWVNDYITYDANRLGNGLTQVVYTNTDRASLAGTELFVQTDLTAWIQPYATLAYVQGTDLTAVDRRRSANLDSSRRDSALNLVRKSATEALPQMPPLESRVGFRFHQPVTAPKWSIDFSARMVSGQNHVATSLGEQATPGFTVFNIRGFWQINDMILVTAGVENLGDRNYREHLDPISGNVLGTGALLRPGTNFFFNTSIKY
jgi:iron complex outermembrane recepter protein